MTFFAYIFIMMLKSGVMSGVSKDLLYCCYTKPKRSNYTEFLWNFLNYTERTSVRKSLEEYSTTAELMIVETKLSL